MFDGLSAKLQGIFKKLSGRGKLSEQDVKLALREVRLALLEADVNFTVVKSFINTVTERAVGAQVLESLTPAQQIIKIVNEELTALMGGQRAQINFGSQTPAVLLLAGLQGAGKTTMAGKLAAHLKKAANKKPLLVAADIYRPAAIRQLQVVGEKLGIPVFERGEQDPVLTAQEAVDHARKYQHDLVILDTAGRLHLDDNMMQELERLAAVTKPAEILLVVDAMTGQDAVNVAQTFDRRLSLTGVILTKLDGDARGGAALSVAAVTGKPIKYVGVGEKLSDIEPFHPGRMASRILGMGDVLTLIEKAQSAMDEDKAKELERRLRRDEFTLDDFLDQLRQVKGMGSMQDLLAMMPGLGGAKMGNLQVDEQQLARTEAIICSMTREERARPQVLNAGRRRRIAKGSGTSVQEVNRLLNQYESTKKLIKQFAGSGKKGFRGRKFPFGGF